MDAEAAFLRVLTIVRVEDQERKEFAQTFQETFRKLEPIQGTNRVRWTELVQLIFGWVLHRRPGKEREEWIALAAAAHEDELHQAEVRTMGQALGKTIFDEGQEEHARSTLLKLGRIRFGEPDANTLAFIQTVEELDRLDRMTEHILTSSSWAEVLGASDS